MEILMARFLCSHTVPGVTQEQIDQALSAYLAQCRASGLSLERGSCNASQGRIFCEVEAPNREAVEASFRAINFPIDEIVELERGYAPATGMVSYQEPNKQAMGRERQ
jgi:hypothetical protein